VTDAPRVTAARWVLRGLLLFTLTFANLHDIWSPDVVPNALLAWTLIRERNIDFDEFVVPRTLSDRVGSRIVPLGVSPEIPRDTYFFRPCRHAEVPSRIELIFGDGSWASPRSPGGPPPPGPSDHVCSIFPPGISLLALPVLAPAVLLRVSPADGASVVRLGHLAAALMETVAALLLWSVIRRFTRPRWALALVLLYWLATSVRTVAAQALWQHAGVHIALALALWLVLHERVSIRRELVAGLFLGLGVVVRQTTAIVALGMSALGHRAVGIPRVSGERTRAGTIFLLGAVVGAVPLFLYNAVAFGSPFEHGYGDKPFYIGPIGTGLNGLLISPSRGILVYEPWIIAALGALALAWLRPGLVALRLRTLSLAWVLLLITYAAYEEWWGGRVFGPRFLDDMAPALIAALAWGISQGILSRTWARVAFWIAAAWSLLLFNAAALVYDPNGWDTIPVNVNFDPSKLFSWSDPQWLNVLTSLGSADLRVLVAAALSALLVALLLRLELRDSPTIAR
jgi:hypothetical protein